MNKLIPDPRACSEKRLFALDLLRGIDMIVLVAWHAIGTTIGEPISRGATRFLCRVNEVTGEVMPRSRPVEDP